MVRLAIALAAVPALVSACSTNGARDEPATVTPPSPPTTPAPATPAKVHLATPAGEVTVNVEVVATAAKIERGLMYRQHMPPDDGMLFFMGQDRDWTFYMRNTLIPLDMIFITRDLTVAGIVADAEPRTETLRRVGVPSRYVLEVNGGWAAAHGVVPGAKVRFEGPMPPHP